MGLTPREIDVVRLLAQGKPNKIIAADLGLSERTVKEYLSKVYKKLRLGNRTEVALWAAQVLRVTI